MQNPTVASPLSRNGFLRRVGAGLGAFWLMPVVGSCAGADDALPATNQKLTFIISWNDPKHANLKVKGGYTIEQGVLIAHTKNDEFVAVSSVCTFDNTQLVYKLSSDQFYCGKDGSNYDLRGIPVNGAAVKPLTIHPVVANKTIGQFTVTL